MKSHGFKKRALDYLNCEPDRNRKERKEKSSDQNKMVRWRSRSDTAGALFPPEWSRDQEADSKYYVWAGDKGLGLNLPKSTEV